MLWRVNWVSPGSLSRDYPLKEDCSNSPTANWFEPGREYFYYETVEDIEMILDMPQHMVELTAKRFREKVIKNHHPKVFWDKVLKKAGVRANASVGA